MKQFNIIFKFELLSYLKNKIFIGVTLAFIISIAVALSFPSIAKLVKGDTQIDTPTNQEQAKTILINADAINDAAILQSMLQDATDKKIERTSNDINELTALVDSAEYDSAIFISSPVNYTYIVKNSQMYDTTKQVIDQTMRLKYRLESMEKLGISTELSSEILSTEITSDLIQTGKNQMQNFLYTYVLIMALYIAIMLYGQFIATSVATEKSSRAMELLITSARPANLMFGKVLGAGTAGLLQMTAILGAAFVFFNLNKSSWAGNASVNSLFNMPISIMLYTILFFILGYLIYSFLYGAIGSLASKVEDINTSIMPITFLFIIAFFIVMLSISSGNTDSSLMIIASFVPFTSPMAMFARIAMGDVPVYQIIISVLILICSVGFIGWLSAKIYRIGVLLYGNPPKLTNIIKGIINIKRNKNIS